MNDHGLHRRSAGIIVSLILATLACEAGRAADVAIRLGTEATTIEKTGAAILAEVIEQQTGSPPSIDHGAPRPGDILIGTPDSSSIIRDQAAGLGLEALGEEGFVVRPVEQDAGRYTLIASNGPRGILYGCAAVADRVRLGTDIADVSLRERPALRDRNLWAWNRPSHGRDSIFHIDRMRDPAADPHMQRLGRYLAQARINALTLWPAPRIRPDSADASEEALDAYRNLARWLREHYGVETYLFTIYEVERGLPPPFHGWPLCTFDERVIEHWRTYLDRLARNVPDLRGLVMAGAGGDWVRGPWECECEKCEQHTDRELIVRAMRMIGEPWSEAGGRLIWKAVTDRPTRVPTEVEHFANLDDQLPPNTQIAHKNFYKDFRQPHPLMPMFYAHADQREHVRPYLVEFQIYGEYRGGTDFPCVMIDRWGEVFPLLTRKNYAGAMAICSFVSAERWDHPLNMANWYAFGRYAWNPDTPPDEIYRDWAALTFGSEAPIDEIIELCRTTYDASTKMMFFKGVMIQNHSKLPTIDYELDSSLVGPWHDIPKAPDGYWGRAHDLSAHPPEVAEQIRNDPDLLLWAHRVPITPELCDEAIAETREAWQLVERMAEQWNVLPHEGWEDLHREVSEQFRRNRVDAEVWYENHRLYFDYKAGRLTRSELRRRLDDIQARFNPEDGTGLIRGTFERFIQEWERTYKGYMRRHSMEGAYRNPAGEPFLPGFKPEP